MKKTIMLSLLIISGVMSFAQTKDSVFIYREYDDMDEKTYYFPSRKIVCSTEDNSKGFTLSAFVDVDSDSNFYISDLNVFMFGIGACVEKNEIVILFDDGTKVKSTSWNKFNCKGNAWFHISNEDIKLLETKKITKIKVSNGYSFDSYTSEIPKEDSDYFIQLIYAMKNKKVKQYKDK